MKFSDSNKYYKAAVRHRKAKDLIKFVSVEVWNRLGFVQQFQPQEDYQTIRAGEVTLTENLVFEIAKFSNIHAPIAKIFEAKNEKTNGADLLVSLEFGEGYIKFPFQAKKLSSYVTFKDGVYKSIFHGNGKQFKLIEDYANDITKSRKSFYLFYNYTSGSSNILKREKEEFYGCTFLSTPRVRKSLWKGKLYFKSIHQYRAKPFYQFFELSNQPISIGGKGAIPPLNPKSGGNYDDIIEFYKKMGSNIDEQMLLDGTIKIYPKEEILDDLEWSDLTLIDDTVRESYAEPDYVEKGYVGGSGEGFAPKYHFVFPISSPSILKDDGEGIEAVAPTEEVEKEVEEPAFAI